MAHRTTTILQAAFFALTDILQKETALEAMRQAVEKSYPQFFADFRALGGDVHDIL